MSRLYKRLYRFTCLLIISLTLCLFFNTLPIWQLDRQVTAEPVSANQLVQQGIERYKAGKYNEAIAQWQQALSQLPVSKNTAIIRSNLAEAYRRIGQFSEAIASWEQAIQIYRSQKDNSNRLVAPLLVEQAQAYSELGQHRRAILLAQSAIEIAQKNQDRLLVAAASGTLGSAYYALGDYEQALAAHRASLKVAQELQNSS